MAKLERTVSLVLIVETRDGLKVALRRRGKDVEYPGSYELVIRELVQEDEEYITALMRKLCEEIGSDLTDTLLRHSLLKVVSIRGFRNTEEKTYWVSVHESRFITPEGMELVDAFLFLNDDVLGISSERKKVGYSATTVALSGHEIRCVKSVLDLFD
jgi:hypothetical protein